MSLRTLDLHAIGIGPSTGQICGVRGKGILPGGLNHVALTTQAFLADTKTQPHATSGGGLAVSVNER